MASGCATIFRAKEVDGTIDEVNGVPPRDFGIRLDVGDEHLHRRKISGDRRLRGRASGTTERDSNAGCQDHK